MLKKLPVWSKWLTSLTAGLGAMWLLIAWLINGYEHFEKAQHHSADIQMVLERAAEEEKRDRIQRNYRELARLQRDLIGEKYRNEGEREYIIEEIRALNAALACDERGECK
jgi:hypothetical protein